MCQSGLECSLDSWLEPLLGLSIDPMLQEPVTCYVRKVVISEGIIYGIMESVY